MEIREYAEHATTLRQEEEHPHVYVRKQCFVYVKKNRGRPITTATGHHRTGRSWATNNESRRMSRGQADSWFVATSDFCTKIGKYQKMLLQPCAFVKIKFVESDN